MRLDDYNIRRFKPESVHSLSERIATQNRSLSPEHCVLNIEGHLLTVENYDYQPSSRNAGNTDYSPLIKTSSGSGSVNKPGGFDMSIIRWLKIVLDYEYILGSVYFKRLRTADPNDGYGHHMRTSDIWTVHHQIIGTTQSYLVGDHMTNAQEQLYEWYKREYGVESRKVS